VSSFVLVHGAWHGGWCWEKVVAALEKRGHRASSPDLPAHGQDPTPPRDVSLDRYARSVCEVIEGHDEPVVLVGHSMGGLVISRVAELAPKRIRKLVYLAALVPRDGESIAGVTVAPELLDCLLPSEDGLTTRLPREHLREIFYADCSAEDVERAASRLCAQPIPVLLETAQLSAARFGSVPRIYIECLQDRAVPLDCQRKMSAAHRFHAVHSLESSHSPSFSMPNELAELLIAL